MCSDFFCVLFLIITKFMDKGLLAVYIGLSLLLCFIICYLSGQLIFIFVAVDRLEFHTTCTARDGVSRKILGLITSYH